MSVMHVALAVTGMTVTADARNRPRSERDGEPFNWADVDVDVRVDVEVARSGAGAWADITAVPGRAAAYLCASVSYAPPPLVVPPAHQTAALAASPPGLAPLTELESPLTGRAGGFWNENL